MTNFRKFVIHGFERSIRIAVVALSERLKVKARKSHSVPVPQVMLIELSPPPPYTTPKLCGAEMATHNLLTTGRLGGIQIWYLAADEPRQVNGSGAMTAPGACLFPRLPRCQRGIV